MAINLEAAGQILQQTTFSYTWKDVSLYALAVGATEEDLDLVLELRRLRALPTFSVIPTFQPLLAALNAANVPLARVLHGEQLIELHGPIPRRGTFLTTPRVDGIYDVGKHAILHIGTSTVLEGEDEPLFDTRWTIVVPRAGGFGGERPPAAELAEPPEDREPDFRTEMPTTRTQALLYRLTGDVNPLHAEPRMAKAAGFDRPILHGLCTYGHVGLAVLKALCDSDATRMRSFFARFSKEVYPGDVLTVEGWRRGEQEVLVRARVGERIVLSNGLVRLV